MSGLKRLSVRAATVGIKGGRGTRQKRGMSALTELFLAPRSARCRATGVDHLMEQLQ
jgi:hypothetical protein